MLKKYRFEDMGYWLYIPDDMNIIDNKMPMIVFLHGAGERGCDLELVKNQGIPKMISEGKKVAAVVLCPQCPDDIVWNNIVFKIKCLIDSIAENQNVDKKRISITGLSMGGYGTWEMGLTFPTFFSAIAPICGGGMSWRAGLLKDMPIRAFHGGKDDAVPCSNSMEMVDAINDNGGCAELTIFHNVRHDSWTAAYEKTDLIEWLIKTERK